MIRTFLFFVQVIDLVRTASLVLNNAPNHSNKKKKGITWKDSNDVLTSKPHTSTAVDGVSGW